MSETSYNGWPADEHLPTRPLVVNGVAFAPGIRDNDDVETVFRYIAEQWAAHVEPLVAPGCWGFSYRPNRNDPSKLSCHASATAIDVNAPAHSNGTEASADLIRTVNAILDSVEELADLVHWGGNWHYANKLTPDPMHFELHAYDLALLRRVADRIRNQEDDMFEPNDRERLKNVEETLAELVAAEQARAKAAADRDRRIAANLRTILKERFKATDAVIAEIWAKVDPPVLPPPPLGDPR